MRRLVAAFGLLALIALAASPAAAADLGDERALAGRYAPVVRLVHQEKECGYGEPYRPIDVDVLFGNPTVALRGPWNAADLLRVGTTASDLSQGLFEYHLTAFTSTRRRTDSWGKSSPGLSARCFSSAGRSCQLRVSSWRARFAACPSFSTTV